MVRKLILIVILILSILFIYTYFTDKCKEEYFMSQLNNKISNLSIYNDTFQIKISDLTNFEWDTLLVSKPYSYLDGVNELVGFKWKYFEFQIPYFETGAWLIFKKRNNIVYDFYLDNDIYKNDTLQYYIGFQYLKDLYLYDSSNFKLCYDTIIMYKIIEPDKSRTIKVWFCGVGVLKEIILIYHIF